MYAETRALMAQQHGLITRRQAVMVGLAASTVDELVRRGTWRAVRRGAYVESAVWDSLDDRTARPLLVARAVTLTAAKPHVWSHETAGLALGLALLEATRPLTHVTRSDVRGDRTTSGVKHHGATYDEAEVDEVDGMRVMDMARSAVDVAREHGFAHGLVACDSALAHGVTRVELTAALERMRSWPGTVAARAAVEVADPDVDSPGESLTRGLVIRAGEPVVETQFGLRRGGRTVWCDMRVRRHVIEFDGRVKYRALQDGGVATKPLAEVVWEEKKRQDFVQSFRLGMSRVTWEQAQPDRWRSTGARVLAEIAETDHLFGSDTGDLAPYVVAKRFRPRAA